MTKISKVWSLEQQSSLNCSLVILPFKKCGQHHNILLCMYESFVFKPPTFTAYFTPKYIYTYTHTTNILYFRCMHVCMLDTTTNFYIFSVFEKSRLYTIFYFSISTSSCARDNGLTFCTTAVVCRFVFAFACVCIYVLSDVCFLTVMHTILLLCFESIILLK